MKKADFDSNLMIWDEYRGRTRCWKWFPQEVDEHKQRVVVDGRPVLVHRHAYEVLRQQGRELHGPLKKNQPLVRTCDEPRCISPYHHMPALSQRAIAENGKWTGIKPNDPRGAHNRKKDKCPYGHAFTEENTAWTGDGRRHCKACARERAWLPLELRHIVYPNQIVPALIRRPPQPIHPEADDALWNGEPEFYDLEPHDWGALVEPQDDAGALVEAP